MNKVLVLVKGNTITFSIDNKKSSGLNLNDTNVIDVKNLRFSEEYIVKNKELVGTFLNLIAIKNNINKAIIKDVEIAEGILYLFSYISCINELEFTQNKELSYTITSLLYENKNLKKIKCYSMPELVFYRFPSGVVETRCEILFINNFMETNKINTYSKLYSKDSIIIDNYNLNEEDNDEIEYFFKQNKILKRVILKGYTKERLLSILKHINESYLNNITIIIYEDSNTTNKILKDIQLFNKINKDKKVKIKIKYSKEYKEKNNIKEINFIFLRYILIISIILIAIIVVMLSFRNKQDEKNYKENTEKIEQIVKENEETKVEDSTSEDSPYYKNYENVYSKLLEINSDTKGWIKINNTNINYPVVQSLDNDYYLNHAFDKSKNAAGWVYIDYRNNMDNLDKNIIIYAHDVHGSNIMFSTLKKVVKDSWYLNQSNLIIDFNVKDKPLKWEIFSIYTIPNTTDYLSVDFNNPGEFSTYLNQEISRSIYNFNKNVTENDNILTLSTCYKDSDHRLVVHAKLLK